MSYARKNLKNVIGAIAGVVVLAAIAVWQFYMFVTLSPAGVGNAQGTSHLWWAVAMTVFACGAAFLVLSVFVRHDTDDDLHITSSAARVTLVD